MFDINLICNKRKYFVQDRKEKKLQLNDVTIFCPPGITLMGENLVVCRSGLVFTWKIETIAVRFSVQGMMRKHYQV